MEKKFYRAKEAAEYLGVGVSTIWLWSKQLKLVSKKLSKKVTVWDVNDLNNLLDDESTGENHD